MHLDVQVTREGGTTTVVVVGEIDLMTAVGLDRELSDAIEREPEWLRLDLLGVSAPEKM